MVVDPHGRAIPFDIPADLEGPRMRQGIRDQIQSAIVDIREAVRAHYASIQQGTDVSAEPESGETIPESSA